MQRDSFCPQSTDPASAVNTQRDDFDDRERLRRDLLRRLQSALPGHAVEGNVAIGARGLVAPVVIRKAKIILELTPDSRPHSVHLRESRREVYFIKLDYTVLFLTDSMLREPADVIEQIARFVRNPTNRAFAGYFSRNVPGYAEHNSAVSSARMTTRSLTAKAVRMAENLVLKQQRIKQAERTLECNANRIDKLNRIARKRPLSSKEQDELVALQCQSDVLKFTK